MSGRTAENELMDAVARHDVSAVADLLARGADPNHHRTGDADPTIQPTTPLRLVVFCISDALLDDDGLRQFAEIATLLLRHGADPEAAMQLAEHRYGRYDADLEASPFMDVLHLVARARAR